MKVLLAEDDRATRMILSRVLERWGYEVVTASDGHAALAHVASGDLRMVITDWQMPGLDGPALCARIRQQREPYVYIVLLTSFRDPEHLVQGLEAGADDFIAKPFDPAELRARLNVGRRILRLQEDLSARADALRRANEALSRIAATDALLGIGNRRAFDEALARTHAAATAGARPFGLLLGDIDHFKDVNDRHGHLVGDQVLIQVADALRGALGADGEVFRYGGEELVAIVNTADNLDALVRVAERLRAAVASRAVQVEHDARPLSVTLSLGAARWTPAEALGPEALVHRADVALYASKHGGRDRVTAWSSALGAAPDPR